MISFVKVAKERFTKHFGHDENNFVEDNFSFRLIYQRVIFAARCAQITFMDLTDLIIYNCFVSENYKQLQQGRSLIFLMGGWESHPRLKNLRNSKLGMETRNHSSKSWYEALTPR